MRTAILDIFRIAMAAVLVHGKRCAVLGRVTMDLMMIDVTEVDAKVGDEVVLMGRQGGGGSFRRGTGGTRGDYLMGDHNPDW